MMRLSETTYILLRVWFTVTPHQLTRDSVSNDRRCLPGISLKYLKSHKEEEGGGGGQGLNREIRYTMFRLYCIYCTGIIIVRKLLTLPYTMDENFAKLQNKTGLYPRAPTDLQIRY